MKPETLTRRAVLKSLGAAITPLILPQAIAAEKSAADSSGAVTGDPVAAKFGLAVLQAGGNAIDAAVTAAFVSCICSPSKCGIGGYGGHAVIGLAEGRTMTAVDFDSTAPLAARPDMFPLDAAGRVRGNVNQFGWLAAGVPGTLAGLELILTRFGTRSLRDMLAPALALAEEGAYVAEVKGIDDADASRNDPRPDSALTTPKPTSGGKQRNAALVRLLRTLAQRNSVDSFYRGDLAQTLADTFQRNGGLVTRADLAAYRAREVATTNLEWNGFSLHSAPLPASGALVLSAIAALKALKWKTLSREEQLHARLEALRIAWSDRQHHWGDPDHVAVPLEQLLSASHAEANARLIRAALDDRRPVPLKAPAAQDTGTVNISASDNQGNMIALTLTHGGGYGARVSVPELGIILGHGMSRFDPQPGRPNSPAPGKRPITNMCPTLVTRHGQPVFAVGGAGGTRIPSSVYEVLLQTVALGVPLRSALAAPRLDCTGTLAVELAGNHSAAEEALLRNLGYTVKRGPAAYVSAAAFDPTTRKSDAHSA